MSPTSTASIFVGIDVQVRRGCPYFVMAQDTSHIESGWLPRDGSASDALQKLLERLGQHGVVAVGIDAPSMPLPDRRQWSWSAKRGWSTLASSAPGRGRHCEIVISAHRLANPQWTPTASDAPAWMQLGFSLFARLSAVPHVYEVFPSAAYTQLANDPDANATISFATCAPGPRDMLDAAIGAFTVREFVAGRGCEAGGGDGLGTIVLPRALDVDGSVHVWPSPYESAV